MNAEQPQDMKSKLAAHCATMDRLLGDLDSGLYEIRHELEKEGMDEGMVRHCIRLMEEWHNVLAELEEMAAKD